jgi:hypothetical protein
VVFPQNGYSRDWPKDIRTLNTIIQTPVTGIDGIAVAVIAVQQALACPWLDFSSLSQARSVLVNITGGTNISLTAVHKAATTSITECLRTPGKSLELLWMSRGEIASVWPWWLPGTPR